MIQAWNDDARGHQDDSIMDTISIPVRETGTKFDQFGHYIVLQGDNKIGNFTLIYYNLTTGPTSNNLMEHPTSSTSSPTPLSLISPDAVLCMSCTSTEQGNMYTYMYMYSGVKNKIDNKNF